MARNKILPTTQNSINPLESLMNILPDDRPIRSLQVVENYGKCQQNFPLHKTLDLDDDADIFKENILFGKRNTRYLCISKTEGHSNFVVEKLQIINSNENLAQLGFVSIKNTADTNQKAWRKKQLVYKLSKTEIASECITDICILSKFKNPLPGFIYLGELEKVHICYKTAPVKPSSNEIIDFTQQIENLRIQSKVYPSVSALQLNTPN
jgi:ESCRT-I complex subunit MVB12